MPFKSKKQQRFMFSTMPEKAKEWAEKTDFSKLPEKAKKKSKDKNDTVDTIDIDNDVDDKLAKMIDMVSIFVHAAVNSK
jgi:hypothetical protein